MDINEFNEQRNRYIQEDFSYLNREQLEAVISTEGPLLILAGAGSGKTTVLINRIANILKYGSVPDRSALDFYLSQTGNDAADYPKEFYTQNFVPVKPWQVLAITFTNKAADELKQRLFSMLGEDTASDIWACTFHSSCLRILRREAERIGYAHDFTIYDTDDSLSLIKKMIKENNIDEKAYSPKSLLNAISSCKNNFVSPEAFSKQINRADIRKNIICRVYREYMNRLHSADAMDFDDLLYNVVYILENYPEAREYWQNRFRYILVDEYQDTNYIQYRFAKLLSEKYNNICVVGDDDQSIYKFRGATIDNILNFENEFDNCRVIKLEQNYRSTGNILNTANCVIRNNSRRKGKELWTTKEPGEKITVQICDNQDEEAQYVSNGILSGIRKGCSFSDYAVLYRMNAQSNALEYSLKRNGIPYRIIGGTRFYDRAEVKDVLAYLNLIASHNDDLRLLRIINTPARGIGARSIELVTEAARESNVSIYELIGKISDYPHLAKLKAKFQPFVSLIDYLTGFSENNTPDVLFDEMLEKTGYLKQFESDDDPKNTVRKENVLELKSNIVSYMEQTGDETLSGFLANAALYSDIDNYDRDSDAVVLMTMHSAKGLEFPYVYISGMEETVFPGLKSIGDPEEMEEERRLCYVAITRAKKELCLTGAKNRLLYGRTNTNKMSRFIDEMPDECLVKNIPKNYGYSDTGSISRDWQTYGNKPERKKAYSLSGISDGCATDDSTFSLGDNVVHNAFGTGVIVKMTPMGGDSLVEINFQNYGKKLLMLRTASKFLKKIN